MNIECLLQIAPVATLSVIKMIMSLSLENASASDCNLEIVKMHISSIDILVACLHFVLRLQRCRL